MSKTTKDIYMAQFPIRTNKTLISSYKALLEASDYKAIKYAEGLITEEDYAETKALRQSYRDAINELEAENVALQKKIEGVSENE